MSIVLNVSNLKKEFGERVLFDAVSFELEDCGRLAIVGPNGCGKSTLLNIIAGNEESSSGNISIKKDMSLGYLMQYQDESVNFDDIHSYVLAVRDDILRMEEQLFELENKMSEVSGDELAPVMEEYHSLSHSFDALGGNTYRSEVVGVLKGLGFNENDFTKAFGELSGGQKTRVNLARLLLMKPDILLLDEPVNHLDMASIEWLETFLSNYKKGIIIVAHDRYFLDRVVSDVLDISGAGPKLYHGNYSSYVEQRAIYMQSQKKAFAKQQKEIEHQEEVIAKLKQFNRQKSIRRAESRKKKLDRLERMDAPKIEQDGMKLTLDVNIKSGRDVLTVEGLGKAYGEKKLFSQIDFGVYRGERVAIIGENGCGKTTILKILNEAVEPDAGIVRIGAGVEIAYFDQEQQNLDETKTLYDELSDAYADLTETAIRNVLAAFLFRADDAFKVISELSGGERGRISLAKLMLSGANFLILDEPTNHLDMESKEILANALKEYQGTVLYVSHDRYFINQTADRILELSAEYGLTEYLGNYDYYLQKRESIRRIGESREQDEDKGTTSARDDWKKQKEEAAKERRQKAKRGRLEERIMELEEEREDISEMFSDEEIATNSARLNELTDRVQEIEAELNGLYEEWEELA